LLLLLLLVAVSSRFITGGFTLWRVTSSLLFVCMYRNSVQEH
jgi:hypothetical protein